VYYRLKCPELLLWLAEASYVDIKMIAIAESVARLIIDIGNEDKSKYRTKASEAIKKIIPWDEIEFRINLHMKYSKEGQ